MGCVDDRDRPAGGGVVADPPDPASVLTSPLLDVVPFADRIAVLSARTGLDFSTTVFALRALPLAADRSRHAPMRRALAAMMAPRLPILRARMPTLVAARLEALAAPGDVDMMAEVVVPLVGDVLEELSGVGLGPGEGELVSRLFSEILGPARRVRLEGELRALRARVVAAFPDAAEDDIGQRMALVILGRDALIGTLARSLHALFREGRPFADLDWPEAPPATGVPFVDRVAVAEGRLGNHDLRPGDTLRAALQLHETGVGEMLGFFGAGAHLCLGRTPALDLWREIGRHVATLPGRPEVTAFALRKDDVFAFPEPFRLKVA
ncbi:hypothetical protein ACRDNQ_16150 [Palleronia sp. KMU-117]|uniref:hypothetical protein n=1 Tax=Palleronia sp. KMU-117 TaxID=3434108 RepID=UPI003D71A787